MAIRLPRTYSQGAQADELGQIGDGFERATAARAKVVDVFGRRPVAPYACAAGQAFGMRHAHAAFVTTSGVVGHADLTGSM